MDFIALGKRIRKYREAKKYTQEELSKFLPIDYPELGNIERGTRFPAIDTFVEIANALGVSADELLCDSLKTRYEIKTSIYSEKINALPEDKRKLILDYIDFISERN